MCGCICYSINRTNETIPRSCPGYFQSSLTEGESMAAKRDYYDVLGLTELSGLERSYYDTCRSFVSGNLTTAAGWAAYASRVTAVDVLTSGGIREEEPLFMGDVEMEIPQELQELEQESFLQIIVGEKPLDYFDVFVEQWYEKGGEELTERVRSVYEEGCRTE